MTYIDSVYSICDQTHICITPLTLHSAGWVLQVRDMGIFKSLFGGKPKNEPGWNIKPASERPAAWTKDKAEVEQPVPVAEKDDPHPFLDDKMLDTMQLEAETLHEDNPYQTHTWEKSPEEDTRKMRTIQIGKAEKKDKDAVFNPYDTGQLKRGWKD